MKLKTQYMALIVGIVLFVVFAYQVTWLVMLYHNETTETRRRIQHAVVMADYIELDMRTNKIRQFGTVHGTVTVTSNQTGDSAYVETIKRREHGDSVFYNVQRRPMRSQERDSVNSHPLTWQFEDRRNDSILIAQNPMLGMTYVVQRTTHYSLDQIVPVDFARYDSLLTCQLHEAGLDIQHLTERIDSTGVVIDSISTPGYHHSPQAERFVFFTAIDGLAAYRLTTKPVKSIVLRQMAGILATSAIILIVLIASFWYLIHTVARMRTLDEMKSDFTNNMTHELKTPIAVAYAANDALLNFEEQSEKTRQYLLIGQEQLAKLSEMVEQILNMSLEKRTKRLNIATLMWRDMIDALVEAQRLKSDKPTDITVDITPSNASVKADRQALSSMVNNLIDNAIKYSGDEAHITISCHNDEIVVSDQGIGIPHSKLPFVFDKFYRVPQGDRHDVKGYGLGLYYVKQMMTQHGGNVEIESDPGKGTTIKLKFNGNN